MATPNISKAERFYRTADGGKTTDAVIEQFLNENEAIVFGARATNRHLPAHLDKPTVDWDLLTRKDPTVIARVVEKALDRRFGGNFFFVEPALHPGTFKVKSVVTGATAVDISGLDEIVPNVEVKGINYATLDHQVKNIKRSLADPASSFRHNKDRETLQRIDIFRGNNPNYYVKDLAEIVKDEFGIKAVRRSNNQLHLVKTTNGGPISEDTITDLSAFIEKFYPQLAFERTNGGVVLRESVNRRPMIRRQSIRR